MTFYGTVVDADAYHLARGNAVWATKDDATKQAALTTGSDYVDSFRSRYPGKKTGGRSQEREWPRTDASDKSGEEIASDEVPVEVEYATYEGALMVVQGISLTATPPTGSTLGRTTFKRVKAGPVETETHFSENEGLDTDRPWFQKIMDLLGNLFTGSGAGATLGLLRI
jgi:hypothetical protein